MKCNRRLLSALLTVLLLLTALLPGAAAAELSASYQKASYYDIATTAYSRMLMFQDGVVAAADQTGKYGLIDVTGAVKVAYQYDELFATGTGYYIARKGEQMGIIDTAGQAVYPLADRTIRMEGQNISIMDANYNYTYLNNQLQPITQDQFYGHTGSSSPYYWINWVDDSYGIAYGDDGSVLVDANEKVIYTGGGYDSMDFRGAYNGTAYLRVYSGQQSALVDQTGKVIIPMGSYSYIGGVNASGYVSVSTWTLDASYQPVSCVSELYSVASGQKVQSWTDREVTTETYFRDLVFSLDKEKFGTMDAAGKVLIPNQFDTMMSAGDPARAIVGNEKSDGWSYYYGMYSADGQQLLAPKYSELEHLGQGYYRVYDDTHYGIADGSGTFTVPLSYRELRVYTLDFIEAVSDSGGSKALNAKNQEIIPQSLEKLFVYNDLNTYSYNEWYYHSLTVSYDNYEGDILPFRVKTAAGYSTYYVDQVTGECLGSLPVLASNITADGRFVYRDNATGLYGFGLLTAGSFANPAAPTSGIQTAYATSYSILVDGKPVQFDAYALKDANGNDTNYLKLRDVAYILNGSQAQFNVDWNAAAGAIAVTTKTPYTTVNGSEMSTPFSGNQSYQPNKAAVLVDGQAADLEAITLTDANGNGYTYFKVRDLGQALGFDVTWDSAQGAILIDTTKPYSG